MLHPFDLRDNFLNTRQEALRVMIMQYVHVNALIATGHKSLVIFFSFYKSPDRSKHKGSGVDRLDIASRHLENHGVGSRHDSDEFCPTLDTPTSFVRLGFVARYLEF